MINPARLSAPELRDLVGAIARGDRDALERAVVQFRSLVYATAARSGLGPADVEDVAQETWIRLFQGASGIRRAECLPAWLGRTARNASLSRLREQNRVTTRSSDAFEHLSATDDPLLDVMRHEEDEALHSAMAQLAPRDQALLGLIMDKASYRSISRQLGMPMGSIGPTRERILGKLAHSAEMRMLSRDRAAPQAAATATLGM